MAQVSPILLLAIMAIFLTLVSGLNLRPGLDGPSLEKRKGKKGQKSKGLISNPFIPGVGLVRYPNGVSVEDAYQMSAKSKNQNGHIFAVLANNSTRKVCVFGERTDLTKFVHFPLNKTGPGIYLAPNQTVQLGNLGTEKDIYNGRFSARHGCDNNCDHCPGPRNDVLTLAEWTWDGKSKGTPLWSDISGVDGHNIRMNFTIMSNGGVCSKRSCPKSLDEVKELCPPTNFWQGNGTWFCQSDCKIYGTPEACGIGAGEDKPSSPFLIDICSNAYAYASDDKHRNLVNDCNGTGKNKPRAMIMEVY